MGEIKTGSRWGLLFPFSPLIVSLLLAGESCVSKAQLEKFSMK